MKKKNTTSIIFFAAAGLFFLAEILSMLSTEPQYLAFYAIAGFVSIIFGFVSLRKNKAGAAEEAKKEENPDDSGE